MVNQIIHGDCLDWLPTIPAESVDMCYIDPPFCTNQHLDDYDDRWSDIVTYIGWMEERVRLIHKCLKNTGSIFLHCDWRASHRLRVMLDAVFEEKNFVNEIIWCYSAPSHCTRHFPRKHDTILFYSKSGNHSFNTDKARTPHSRQNPSNGSNSMVSGKRSAKEIRLLELERLKKGKIIEDWWTDIPSGGHISKHERIGYKTQKPEKLLDRIISCSTNKGDIVLDCFVGGGTTAVVAAKLGRRFIVGDISERAIEITRQRVESVVG